MSSEAPSVGIDTKTAIIEAAIRLISLRGFERVSTRDIAKAVGIASPSLYKHFASIAEITAEALKVITARRRTAYRQVLSDQLEPREALKQIAIVMISGFLEDPTLIHLYQQVFTSEAGAAFEVVDSLWEKDLIPRFFALIKNVDPHCNPSFSYFVLFSFSLGAATYLPTHEKRRPLSARERSALLLAERGLTAALPGIDWTRVSPASTTAHRRRRHGPPAISRAARASGRSAPDDRSN